MTLDYDSAKAIYMRDRAETDSCDPAIPNYHMSSREGDSWLFRTKLQGKMCELGRVFDDGHCDLYYATEEEEEEV